ncbi:hypothetical protein [Sphingomonas sp.]|uniref:hypothetical protein n=1 Tax=Sphingomonas sp. TaxID=28214 RepID=UPI00289781F7|nr:hypothetical protein [Sphingomonas sp.]
MPYSNDARAQLLVEAEADVRRWCRPRDQWIGGNRHPDTHWLALFTGLVTEGDAHRFLVTFQLTNHVIWRKQAVAHAIMGLRAKPTFDPVIDIPVLAGQLSTEGRMRQHSSAASKIATFARPEADVFIWDRLASKSARHRDWHRAGRTGWRRLNSLYRKADGHDYAAFWRACAQAREDERQKSDFRAARDRLIADFRGGAGGAEMADPVHVPDGFIERRLLDKLMFAEGRWIERYRS